MLTSKIPKNCPALLFPPASMSPHTHTCSQWKLHAFLPPATTAELAARQTLSPLSHLNTHTANENITPCCTACFHALSVNLIGARAVYAPKSSDAGSVAELKWRWLPTWQPQTCDATASEYQRGAPTGSEHRGTAGPPWMMSARLPL